MGSQSGCVRSLRKSRGMPGCPGYGPETDAVVVSTLNHNWSKCTQSRRTEHVGSQSWGSRGAWRPRIGVLASRSKEGFWDGHLGALFPLLQSGGAGTGAGQLPDGGWAPGRTHLM